MASITNTPGTAGMSPIKKKQYMLLGGLVGVVAIISVFTAVLGGSPAPQVARKPDADIRKTFGTPESVKPEDVWRTQEGARVSVLQNELNDLRVKMQTIEQNNKEREPRAVLSAPIPPAPPPPQPEQREQRIPVLQPAAVPQGSSREVGQLGMPGEMAVVQPQEKVKGIVRIDISKEEEQVKGKGGKAGSAQVTAENFLPAGTFMRGITLAGLDAPTGGQVQQNPHPVLFRVTDFAQMPNWFKADVKECFVTANGYGDISSERAYLRLDRLSCIDERGGAIDVDIKGFAAGEDGKAGMRGRLVTKQGQVLANALVAGVAGGIGQGFAQQGMTTSTSPLGSTTAVNQGKEMQVGIGQGVGKALDQLAKYYIQLAEKMFPIIEIDAGREVDLVITKGMSIERR